MWNVFFFLIQNWLKFVSKCALDNGLAPSKRQAFIWTDNGQVLMMYICICVSSRFGELKSNHYYLNLQQSLYASKQKSPCTGPSRIHSCRTRVRNRANTGIQTGLLQGLYWTPTILQSAFISSLAAELGLPVLCWDETFTLPQYCFKLP